MKKLFAALSAVFIFVLLCTAFYLSRKIPLFGTDVRADSLSLEFDGSEIPGFDKLNESLSQFHFLKEVNLGDFPIYAEQEKILCRNYPEIQFTYIRYTRLGDLSFPSDSTEIDLSEETVNDTSFLIEDLSKFDKVSKVVFGNNILKSTELQELHDTYPNIEFSAIAKYNIYGKWIREDETEIDLKGIVPDEHLTEVLSVFKKAEYIDLHGVILDEETKLSLCERYPSVRFGMTAVLGGLEFDTDTDFIDLNWNPIYDIESFDRSLKMFKNVTRIEMCGCYVSNEDMAALCDKYPNIKFVWRVFMGRWSVRTDAVAFSVLIADYTHKRLTSEDIEVLKYCPDLEALDLGHQSLTDISCIPEYMPKLKVLILADNRISDISSLAKLKNLHYLELFVNRVTDLSPLAECKELVDLNISYNYAIEDITPLLELPLLERLWLEHTSVSAKDINLLRKTYPEATIVNIGKGSIDKGWRTHERYYNMIDMFYKDYISESFTKYDNSVING